ncbi:TonB-dependent receptor plug domain-containing protein [Acinetobacter sp. c3-l95]|uniref:TonB-dependent receptor plug domain-containing protein n=1 Tax=Acinetobacter sp. c3-l95 TaxID=3342804 RepID=UPI0035BAAE70
MATYKYLVLPLLALSSSSLYANNNISADTNEKTDKVHVLDDIVIVANSTTRHTDPIGVAKASDITVKKEEFKRRSSTVGNALANEIGIHSNPFGGGASSPIIRGQEGVRIKILQNGTDVVDMSSVSPDHAVAADTLLADQVEVVRGSSTLMYAMASAAGVVNIVDKRIPTTLPENGQETEVFSRYNSNSKEKLVTLGTTIGLADRFALRIEGLSRNADNYHVNHFKPGDEIIKFLPDSYNHSKVGTVGLSWIGDKGYIGAAYSSRRDQYGIPGHNHMLDSCTVDIFDTSKAETRERRYLYPFPHLMVDQDIRAGVHTHCGNEQDSAHDHSHDNPYGHKHDHSSKGPWIDLSSQRYDFRATYDQPLKGLDKIKLSMTYSDYQHDEMGDGKAYVSPHDARDLAARKRRDALALLDKPLYHYANKGLNTRLEFFHTPIAGFDGVLGLQYQTQTSQAVATDTPSSSLNQDRYLSQRTPLIKNTNKQWSVFGIEQYRHGDFTFDVGFRAEKQAIPIEYNLDLLERYTSKRLDIKPDLSTYKKMRFHIPQV